jgi:Na+/proline symporter
MFDVFTTLFGGVGPIYLLRWLWWRINAWSEIAALLSSAAATLVLQRWPALAAPLLPPGLFLDGRPTFAGALLVVVAASLLVGLAVTLLTRPVDRAHLAAFHARVAPPGRWRPALGPGAPAARRPVLVRVLGGWMLGSIALLLCVLLPGALLLGASGAVVAGLLGAALLGLALVARTADAPDALAAPGDRHPDPGRR